MHDGSITSEDIKKTLEQNVISRNSKLNLFLGMLNAVDAPSIISLDGAWGSGKTYFVKQIEFLGQVPDQEFKNTFKSILDSISNTLYNGSTSNIPDFRDTFVPYYFNAWENDQADDPLQALLFSLLNDIEKAKSFRLKCFQNGLKAFDFDEFLKNISYGLIDSKKMFGFTDTQQLAKEYITAKERCKTISEMLQKLTGSEGKKLLFIIDELDRCKPSFAVRLLEEIKHCCTSNNVVFLLATNNLQLVHTVQHFYGVNFDGAEYLNKFYDLQFNIGDVDIDNYIEYRLGDYNAFVAEVARQLHMTMREMNRYTTMVSMVRNYIRYEQFGRGDVQEKFCKTVLVPLALGLKIKRPNDFQQLYNGDGGSTIREFIEHCSQKTFYSISCILKGRAIDITDGNDRNGIKEKAIENYNDVFLEDTRSNVTFCKQFLEVLTLINTASSIPLDIS